jgi:U3 small nucleolar ribonucleoprotein protein IMP4
LRRLARERRDYIYRKSLEAEEKKRYEKKRKIAEYLKGDIRQFSQRTRCTNLLQRGNLFLQNFGKTKLNFARNWRWKEFQLVLLGLVLFFFFNPVRDVSNSFVYFIAEPRNHFDDEYARAGITDPKIFLTTSRDPSSRLIQFVKVCTAFTQIYLFSFPSIYFDYCRPN